MRGAPTVVVILGLLGCSNRNAGRDPPDSSAPKGPDLGPEDAPLDAPPHDASSDSDADLGGTSDGGCLDGVTWSLAPRAIDRVALVGLSRWAVTERYLVGVRLHSPCERLAGIDVTITPGGATDFVGLAASAWVPTGRECLPSAPVVERVVSIPGRQHGNDRVTVSDDHPPGGVLLSFEREPCPGGPECLCGPATPVGGGEEWSACVTDCDCGEGLSCIGFHGLPGPIWNCAQICSDFSDCDDRETCVPPVPDGAPYVCGLFGDLCENDEGCPDGFECTFSGVANFCADQRIGPTGRTCACDADCPAGHSCVEAGPGFTCEIACPSDSWCPEIPARELICSDGFVCLDG